jgi:hypothetical protein
LRFASTGDPLVLMATRWLSGKVLFGGACSFLVIWWLLFSYHTWAFHGDGNIHSGILFYPKHVVTFSEIPLFKTGEYQFRFKGVPSEELSLEFNVVGKAWNDATQLTGLNTQIQATLADDRGRVICAASGSPTAGVEKEKWILTYTSDSAAFYNLNCLNIQFRKNTSYVLKVRLDNVDSRSPKANLVPTLSGGGIDIDL